MPYLTRVSWRVFERFLIKVGCKYVRQKGDHRIYWKVGLKRPIVLPMYKSLPVFIIKNNLRTLKINVEEYLKIVRKTK
ncbi:hypothetical protein A3G67_03910 [Candidatus Roizmanbacteria bacterium RIFCSPLOWO2_12_FULL_40_12]|uniref:Addiction module toxin, HicA family n=1 Tax=Candidatus Roizmanbacteria bacterium RIFCSPLOWO2_01_FULL_40_42 TaxID=1802066 RepID=A0A1F7J5S0_9BACT|nr:MAG: hypothetical protein A2779_03545 [Candidatus Roizmanbacteria bacterium RIFCSPHIGHO2_01_FULL_40_98]OGK28409.1 MAG: hypothetical protein A3C31_00910 [Candidatus Roizmanbacteria bacterium RIFCSPHIGHO2_02_FULL_40_53]OGK30645.1 MAG: hypothetical protein A2W49_03595 [Candidatus Roizmanbacteria bacterium RIFCSPHIGHO2_12_41_18]OGK35973.1 MAG: hypothetical protein A3E69_03280 [Candidatus Roizmanbacteria bacterium RIFCSPHIGHO2_12_FULL_40_130]OGK50965.1 MAG: hypothetical protein A3B50_01680 [Candi